MGEHPVRQYPDSHSEAFTVVYTETEDLEHILLVCPGYCKVRREFFGMCT